jgi:hypothetical protein
MVYQKNMHIHLKHILIVINEFWKLLGQRKNDSNKAIHLLIKIGQSGLSILVHTDSQVTVTRGNLMKNILVICNALKDG